jgi:putative ABC transport system substrate-binding protein
MLSLASFAAIPSPARAAGKVARVGLLLANAAPGGPAPGLLEAFHDTLRELDYREGVNVGFERRWADNRYDRLDGLAAELVRAKVNVIFASTSQSAQAAKRATTSIPIVFETLGDPVLIGLVPSIPRPGGNVTGVSGMTSELSGKRLQILKEAVPRATRVAVLVHPDNRTGPASLSAMEPTARTLGVELRTVHVRDATAIEPAFAQMARDRIDAFIVLADALLFAHLQAVVDLAVRYKLPAMYPDTRRWIDAGGLMTYGAEVTDLWRRAAIYVDKVLRGARPGDLPIEQPAKFELVINNRAAKAVGLALAPSMLARADRVVE